MDETHVFSKDERAAVYRAIAERRDVRRGFLPNSLPQEVLDRLLSAAHRAPSVGLMQPTRFIVVRNRAVQKAVHAAFEEANARASEGYEPERREHYVSLKLDGLLEAPQHLCIVCDTGSDRGNGLGRQTMPETALYSTVCAIQNLWLVARTEGVGVGWVSILDPDKLRELLGIPTRVALVAYLCLGYVDHFATAPDLERLGWETRIPLDSVVSYDRFPTLENEGAQ